MIQHSFNLMFATATRPYLVPLSATEPAPFGPSAEGWRISKPPAPEPGTAPPVPPGAPRPRLLQERLVAFPVPSGDYRTLQCVKDAVLWIHEAADRGAIGSSRAGVAGGEPADVVECWSLERRELEVLVDKADRFAVSGDGERIVVVSDGTVTGRAQGRRRRRGPGRGGPGPASLSSSTRWRSGTRCSTRARGSCATTTGGRT